MKKENKRARVHMKSILGRHDRWSKMELPEWRHVTKMARLLLKKDALNAEDHRAWSMARGNLVAAPAARYFKERLARMIFGIPQSVAT